MFTVVEGRLYVDRLQQLVSMLSNRGENNAAFIFEGTQLLLILSTKFGNLLHLDTFHFLLQLGIVRDHRVQLLGDICKNIVLPFKFTLKIGLFGIVIIKTFASARIDPFRLHFASVRYH